MSDISLTIENATSSLEINPSAINLDLSVPGTSSVALTMANASSSLEISTSPVSLELSIPGTQGASAQNLKSIYMLAPNSTEDIVIFFTDAAIDISKVIIAPTGGGSIDWNVLVSATVDGAGTNVFTVDENNSETETFTVFDNESVSANKFIRLVISGKTGTISALHLTLFYNLTQE